MDVDTKEPLRAAVKTLVNRKARHQETKQIEKVAEIASIFGALTGKRGLEKQAGKVNKVLNARITLNDLKLRKRPRLGGGARPRRPRQGDRRRAQRRDRRKDGGRQEGGCGQDVRPLTGEMMAKRPAGFSVGRALSGDGDVSDARIQKRSKTRKLVLDLSV